VLRFANGKVAQEIGLDDGVSALQQLMRPVWSSTQPLLLWAAAGAARPR